MCFYIHRKDILVFDYELAKQMGGLGMVHCEKVVLVQKSRFPGNLGRIGYHSYTVFSFPPKCYWWSWTFVFDHSVRVGMNIEKELLV